MFFGRENVLNYLEERLVKNLEKYLKVCEILRCTTTIIDHRFVSFFA
jgi:hypothetical protein